MRTIPMRARKSQSSMSNKATTGLGKSLVKMKHTAKAERRTYIFSIGLFIFTIMGLAVGTVGQFSNQASARENSWIYWNGRSERFDRNYSTNNSGNTSTSKPTTTTSKPTETTSSPQSNTSTTKNAPAAPATTQTKPPVQQPAATTTTPPTATSAPVAKRSVAPTPPEPVTPVNTAGEISTMTAAQATNTTAPVTYTSQQISTEMRNRLLALAVSAATSGAIIYLMSLFVANNTSAGANAIRSRVPVREVVAS